MSDVKVDRTDDGLLVSIIEPGVESLGFTYDEALKAWHRIGQELDRAYTDGVWK